jgi:hypothetical protein
VPKYAGAKGLKKNTAAFIFVAIALIIVGTIYGVRVSAATQSDFWGNFVPGVWANIIGVSIAAVIGVPVGFAINHYVVTLTERRHRRQQVDGVRGLLEQVLFELNLHSATLSRLAQNFANTTTGGTSITLGIDVSTLVLQDMFGLQLIGNHDVLAIGESLVLFQVSSYYARVGELNRLLTFRIQDPQPDKWDRKIADITYSVSFARGTVEYEIQRAVTRLAAGIANG